MPRDEFIGTILRMAARDRYALVEDFPRYLLVLGEIGRNMDSAHGPTVAEQFLDICVRVPQALVVLDYNMNNILLYNIYIIIINNYYC